MRGPGMPGAFLTVMHRPWPAPPSAPVMDMWWRDLLFLHWPIAPELLRPRIPPELELDLWEGQAWIAVVPFRMTGIRFRPLPPIPGTAAFPELNVRTYVRHGDRGGVWFFSLDAANPLAVWVARHGFALPYFNATMQVTAAGDAVRYESRRTHRGAPPAEFRARYGPAGPVTLAARGALEHWLTERYCLYAGSRGGRVATVDVDHAPWPLQPATVQVEADTMLGAHGLPEPGGAPLAHFSRALRVRAWRPRPVSG